MIIFFGSSSICEMHWRSIKFLEKFLQLFHMQALFASVHYLLHSFQKKKSPDKKRRHCMRLYTLRAIWTANSVFSLSLWKL